jgi:ABC-2 type transport system ATP-binding protein
MENIEFYADLYGVPRRGGQEKIDALLAFSNLTPFKRRLAGNLSGGMKQKLGLACALIHTPKVLFLDEPTNGVDPVSRRDFWRILYGLLREKVTIFVSTSYLDEAERFQRLALLHQGKLLALGTPEEVKGLYPGAILEVRCDDPRRAVAVLQELPSQPSALRRPGSRGQPGPARLERDREGPPERGDRFPGQPSNRSSKRLRRRAFFRRGGAG